MKRDRTLNKEKDDLQKIFADIILDYFGVICDQLLKKVATLQIFYLLCFFLLLLSLAFNNTNKIKVNQEQFHTEKDLKKHQFEQKLDKRTNFHKN